VQRGGVKMKVKIAWKCFHCDQEKYAEISFDADEKWWASEVLPKFANGYLIHQTESGSLIIPWHQVIQIKTEEATNE